MQSRYFHYYQLVAWLCVFTVIILTIYLSRGLADYEIYFAAILIGATAVYSYAIRYFFVRYLNDRAIFSLVLYLLIQSFIGAAIGTSMLVLCILSFAYFKLIPDIPADSIGFAISSIFWGNMVNMFSALIIWSFAYLLVVKVRQLYAAKEALATSRLEALSQQLNPHFLFNTLNNIRASILEDPHKARDALAQLADMLRYNLEQHNGSKVALAKELAVVEEYIGLCKIQFEDRLHFQKDIEQDAHQALIPRLLLQLCVENAIKHGISQLKEGGLILIKVSIKLHTSLHIEIINPVREARFKDSDARKNDSLNTGIGLKNIRQRLRILYPDNQNAKASLIFNIENSRAQAQVVLPLEYESKSLSQSKEQH